MISAFTTPAVTSKFKSTSRLRTLALMLVAAATLTATTLNAQTATPDNQSSPASITPTVESSNANGWTIEQLLPLTVSEAWHLAGKDEAKFFDIIQQLAAFSAEKRGITLPDNAEAGKRTGEYIKAQAKLDHGQLLYDIVDRAVRHIGAKAATKAAAK